MLKKQISFSCYIEHLHAYSLNDVCVSCLETRLDCAGADLGFQKRDDQKLIDSVYEDRLKKSGVRLPNFTNNLLKFPMKMKLFGSGGGFERTPLTPSKSSTAVWLGNLQ